MALHILTDEGETPVRAVILLRGIQLNVPACLYKMSAKLDIAFT